MRPRWPQRFLGKTENGGKKGSIQQPGTQAEKRKSEAVERKGKKRLDGLLQAGRRSERKSAWRRRQPRDRTEKSSHEAGWVKQN